MNDVKIVAISFFLGSLMACDPGLLRRTSTGQVQIRRIEQEGLSSTSLHCTAKKGDLAGVQVLLKRGFNPNLVDKRQTSALYLAVEEGHTDIVKLLLENKCDPNLLDEYNWTALHCAASKDCLAIVKLLLEKGANPHLQNTCGHTALHLAVGRDVAEALLENGSNPNLTDYSGCTALHEVALRKDRLGVLLALLAKKETQVNLKNKDGETALHYAARMGRLATVLALLENGSDPNLTSYSGCTALHEAAENSHLVIVQALLANTNRCDPYLTNNKGQTALHVAAKKPQPATIQALLKEMNNIHAINVKDEFGCTALDCAIKQHANPEVLKVFLTNPGININGNYSGNPHYKNMPYCYVFVEAGRDYVEVLQSLVSNPNFNVNASEDGYPFCHELLERDYDDTLIMLLTDPNKRVDLRLKNKNGETLYKRACARNKIQVIKILQNYNSINLNVKI